MAFQPVDHGIHVTLQGQLYGQLVLNNLWLEYSGSAATELQIQNALDFAEGAFMAITVFLSDRFLLSKVTATDEYTESGLTGERSLVGETGLRTIAAYPGNVAVAASLRSGYSNRSANGRIFLGGIPLDGVADGLVSTGFREAIEGLLPEMLDLAFNAEMTWVVASRFHNGAKRGTAVTTPISTIAVDAQPDSQRRRLIGRGA